MTVDERGWTHILSVRVASAAALHEIHPSQLLPGLMDRSIDTSSSRCGQVATVLELLRRVNSYRPAMPPAVPSEDDYPNHFAVVRSAGIEDAELARTCSRLAKLGRLTRRWR